jgi:hypothetical protein
MIRKNKDKKKKNNKNKLQKKIKKKNLKKIKIVPGKAANPNTADNSP